MEEEEGGKISPGNFDLRCVGGRKKEKARADESHGTDFPLPLYQ